MIYTKGMLPSDWSRKSLFPVFIALIVFIGLGNGSVHAMGEPPNWDQVESENAATGGNPDAPSIVEVDLPSENIQEVELLGDDALDLARKTFERMLRQKQFSKALASLSKIPDPQRRKSERAVYNNLMLLQAVEEEATNQSSLFNEDDELNDQNKETVKKLYREAQNALLNNQKDLAKDLLVHIVYIHRRNFKAKKLLELSMDLKTGDYRVQNIEDKYWIKSETFFYGGNYEKAIRALTTLTFFDKDNPEIYERLGSSYYMGGEKENAVDAWTTALFLDPDNKDLEKLIEKTNKLIQEDVAQAKLRKQERQNRQQESKGGAASNDDLQLLGVYPSQTQAYSYAHKLKAQGLKGIVEELENGKWAVKVPK